MKRRVVSIKKVVGRSYCHSHKGCRLCENRVKGLFKIVEKQLPSWGIPTIGVLGKCRDAELVRIRTIMAVIMRHEYDMTLPYIGKKLGGRDHATVINMLKKHKKYLKEQKYEQMYVIVFELQKKLRAEKSTVYEK